MATTLTSLAEYLASSYSPDREYIDGIIQKRHLGAYDHARLQAVLAAWLLHHEREWRIRSVVEQRVQVSPSRFRVPDVTVINRDQPVEQILTRPPLIVSEVLCSEDTWPRMEERIADYLNFAIPNIWILEPATRQAWTITGKHRPELTSFLTVARSPIAIPLGELFQELE